MGRPAVVWAIVMCAGCGSDATNAPLYVPPDCVAGDGEVPVEGCNAGIPPDMCAEGFEADGTMGCRALLPEQPCDGGKLALPGESACRDLVPCGTDKWGDAAIAANTQFVDVSYSGTDSDGSEYKPWKSIAPAIAAAQPGALIAIAAGSYAEDLLIDKPLVLWGRCPSMVELRGVTTATLQIVAGDTQVHGLAITGPDDGIFVSNAENVAIDGTWIHDTGARGIGVQPDFGPASIAMTNCVVEHATLVGVHVVGSGATIDGSGLRAVVENDPYATGYGISVQPDMMNGTASTLDLQRSVIELNHTAGFLLVASQATVVGSVIRATQPSMLSSRDGVGIIAQEGATLTLEASLLTGNHSRGLAVVGSHATLSAVHVSDTAPQEWDQNTGEGAAIIDADGYGSNADITQSTFERNHQSGIFVQGSSAQLDHVLVRDTQPRGSDNAFGRGLAAVGKDELMANVVVESCLFENNHTFGVWIADGTATVNSTMLRGTKPQALDGQFGDGIGIATLTPGLPVELSVTGSRSESSARAGLSVHGAHASISSSSFECNAAFDLLGLSKYFNVENPYVLDDLGANACGCGSDRRTCEVTAP